MGEVLGCCGQGDGGDGEGAHVQEGGAGVKKYENQVEWSGVPHEMAAWGNDGRLWVQVDDMEAVGAVHSPMQGWGGWGLGQNLKLSVRPGGGV